MLELSAVVAIAASGAAIFIVLSVVSIVVWVRYRKERHALALLGLDHKGAQYGRGLESFPADTMTELSRAEGSVLRTHGQLPYGKPTEWGHLSSRESLFRPKSHSDSSFPLVEKARSLRHSLSRSRSKRQSLSSHRRISSLATLGETYSLPSPPPKASISKEDFPLSAVEGILELPAERTPTQTPDPNEDDEGFHLGMRPFSPAWPLPGQKEKSSLLSVSEKRSSARSFNQPPMIPDESTRRLRGVSITSQTAGMMPAHMIPPPPPTAYPLDRLSFARNDSIARLSSMSLDTTNSSILDDGRNGPNSAESDFVAPTFPSSGTFVPFSAADVGVKDGRRSFISTNTPIPPMHNFPVRSSSTTEPRQKSASASPRRSMTTSRHSDVSSEISNTGPYRTGSVSSSNPPSRHASLRSGTPVGGMSYSGGITSDWRFSGSQASLRPHSRDIEDDPFYVGTPGSGTLFHPVGSPGFAGSNPKPPSPMQRTSRSLKGILPSALKGGNSQRKGHRRQNCVRISINPAMVFSSNTFDPTPTVEEEPEDFDKMEELDLSELNLNTPKKPLPSLPPTPMSPMNSTRRSKYGSRSGRLPGLGSLGPLVEEPQSVNVDNNPFKQSKPMPSDSIADKPSVRDHSALPELLTSIPSSGGCLTHTPTPEREPPVWELPGLASPSYENHPGNASPRRSAVKGPRSQPHSTGVRSQLARAPSNSSDHLLNSPLGDSGRLSLITSITGTEGSDWRRSTENSPHRSRADAVDNPFRPNRASISSLDNGLGPIGPSSGLYGGRRSSWIQNRVTIFEDADRTPTKPNVLPPIGTLTTPESSPTRDKNNVPRTMPGTQFFPAQVIHPHGPPTPTSPTRGIATPKNKSLGLGIGTATPGSLYDGDGFLRE